MRPALALALLAALAACAPRRAPPPLPTAQPRYLVGEPYSLGGSWSYPREDFALVETGLAVVAADTRAGRRTANGEVHDPTALMAAHRTLQLPAVLRVTNLDTGLETEVRLNDRGPTQPGRVLELSRRAAELLRIPPGSAARIRLAVVPEPSRLLAARLPGTENAPLPIAAAPVATIQREALPPPPGAREAERVRSARPLPGAAAPRGGPAAATQQEVPLRLPERLWQGPPDPGRLMVEGSSFTRRDLAERQAARVGGRVEAFGVRGNQQFRVRIGPLPGPAAADQALEGMRRAGVSEARILID